MEKYIKPGDFYFDAACPDYWKLPSDPQQNLKQSGQTAKEVRPYQSKTCRKTISVIYGMIYYGTRTLVHEILETEALLAKGNRISSLARVKRQKEDTIFQLLHEPAQHDDKIEEDLMEAFYIRHSQLNSRYPSTKGI